MFRLFGGNRVMARTTIINDRVAIDNITTRASEASLNSSAFSGAVASLGVSSNNGLQGQSINASASDLALDMDRAKRRTKKKAIIKRRRRKVSVKTRSRKPRVTKQPKPRVIAPIPAPETQIQPEAQVAPQAPIVAPPPPPPPVVQPPLTSVGGTNLNNILPQQPTKPSTPVAKPFNQTVTIGYKKVFAGSNGTQGNTTVNVSGKGEFIEAKVAVDPKTTITISNYDQVNNINTRKETDVINRTQQEQIEINRSARGRILSTTRKTVITDTKSTVTSEANKTVHTGDLTFGVKKDLGNGNEGKLEWRHRSQRDSTNPNTLIQADRFLVGVSNTTPLTPNLGVTKSVTLAETVRNTGLGNTQLTGGVEAKWKLNDTVAFVGGGSVRATSNHADGKISLGTEAHIGINAKVKLNENLAIVGSATVYAENVASNGLATNGPDLGGTQPGSKPSFAVTTEGRLGIEGRF
jgi:hypothetical protein